MSRILVAGAAGFLGSHLVDRLLADGSEVVGVDNFVTSGPRNVAHLADHPRFSFVRADITAPLVLSGRFDEIYDLACPASPIDYLQLPFETLFVSSDGTRNLLDRALLDGARFLFTSTSEVYGDPDVHPQPETYWGRVNSIGPRSVYDEGKRYAEALIMAYHRYRGAEVRIARIFNTYGPRMRLGDGHVVPAFGSQALRGESITAFGDGSQTRSYCYVSDLIDGLVRLMASDLTEPCNLGNPHELTVLELARYIRDAVGARVDIEFRPLPQDDPRQRRPDIARAKDRLGWEPTVPFDVGVARTLEDFRARIAAGE